MRGYPTSALWSDPSLTAKSRVREMAFLARSFCNAFRQDPFPRCLDGSLKVLSAIVEFTRRSLCGATSGDPP